MRDSTASLSASLRLLRGKASSFAFTAVLPRDDAVSSGEAIKRDLTVGRTLLSIPQAVKRPRSSIDMDVPSERDVPEATDKAAAGLSAQCRRLAVLGVSMTEYWSVCAVVLRELSLHFPASWRPDRRPSFSHEFSRVEMTALSRSAAGESARSSRGKPLKRGDLCRFANACGLG